MVLLTSGTTGAPKGAPRQVRSGLSAARFLDRVPLRVNEVNMICSPLFHATGLSQLIMSLALGSTVVVRRRFDAEATLRAVEEHRCTALILVPTMLRRIVDLGPDIINKYDVSSSRIVLTSGSALSAELGNRATEIFGDVIHNLYGSTEVSVATVATPQDWRTAPGTVGRPPVGCRVALYDHADTKITTPNTVGRVFAGSDLTFGGYTNGGSKEMIDGLLATGDLGHVDDNGLWFIDGRADEMIISGGENLFPLEIEDCLVSYPGVLEAAVVGIPDEQLGTVLRAFVVTDGTAEAGAEELRAHVKANLARFKVPREIVFMESLPRNATGKLLRSALAARS